MKFEIRSPLKISRGETNKTVSLPSQIKLTDGTVFYTWYPELIGGKGTYDVTNVQGQMNAYSKCAPVFSIINKQSDALKNGRFVVQDDKGNEVKSGNKFFDKFLIRANPLQTGKQFLAQSYAFMKIHGIAYCLPVYGLTRTEPTSFYLLPNFMVKPVYTKKLFQQSELIDIISGFEVVGIQGIVKPEDMLIFRDSAVSTDLQWEKMMQPQSRIVSISDSVNSVIASTDSWVTIAKRKGLPLGIISSGGKDATSTIPLTPDQKDEVHNELNTGYGLSGDAKKFIITAASLNFQQISVPTKDLMLLEGIEAHSRIICNAFNYPFRLLQYDAGSSLSTGGEIKEDRKTLYSEQIIPDAVQMCDTITEYFELKGAKLTVSFAHLEIFQKSKEESARALLSLTAGLEKPFQSKVITAEEYRRQLAQLMDIDPDKPYGNTYYTSSNQPAGQGGN